ncbi:MAG: hypothetical protein EA409_05005 [Saprospirales bacterium]|nr:MAG: hypothetical protein EA409_05005 [Saprospirales bacterium]
MDFDSLYEVLKSVDLHQEGIDAVHFSDGKGCKLLTYRTDRNSLFIKWYSAKDWGQVEAEAEGLKTLGKSGSIRCPTVYISIKRGNNSFLIMDNIEVSSAGRRASMGAFGQQLARLHKENQSAAFGYERNNYIGGLHQENGKTVDWSEFYYFNRLAPQIRLASEKGLLSRDLLSRENEWIKILEIECPEEPPSLVHGDLWGGNLIADEEGNPYVIDPAVAYCHREIDIAMTQLFGGFNPEFYKAYQSIYPLQPGYVDRMEIYQLYFLLVHVNLFGRSYVGSTMRIIEKYFGAP